MSEIKAEDTNFPVRLTSSLKGDLLVDSISGEEQLGRLFVFHFELLSAKPDLHFDKVVGQQVTATLALEDGERYFNGYITEFRYAGGKGRMYRYQATVRPWFWFLTRTSDCRIFQEKSVPDIIKEVFRDNGMADFEDRLKGNYRNWEYCVQYRESDFNFVSRLMEQEGIYYYFEHHDGKHVLVMVDEMSTHSAFQDYSEVTFHAGYDVPSFLKDYLDFWTTSQSILPNIYAVQDFNFKNPNASLLSKQTKDATHELPPTLDPEIFDYPGEYQESSDGENYVKIRLEELQCQKERVQAGGPHRGIAPGCKFTLAEFPREDQNAEHMVISVEHTINNPKFYSEQPDADETYRCRIELMKTGKNFRTARETPKPMVQGLQTAVVVGPASDEIFTDEYGRVKVQFHWDRYGQKDENSSCWIRVSQLWAGKRWGAMHIPRIGQEVIVSFMEGDPDRPIITGRVYNAVNMPPYELEGNKTQSGIKSRSTSGGGPDNFNEIRMEDKIGSEELYIQAEKDEKILVKNNKTEDVGNDETITIGNNRTETVAVDEKLTVNNNRTRNVANTETVTVAKYRFHNVGINEDINIGVAQEVIIGGLQAIEVGASQTVGVGVSQSIEVGRNRSLDVGKDYNINVGNDRNSDINQKESLKIGKDWVVDVGDSVTIKCGSAQIIMKKNGNIQLKGKDITFKASGKMGLKASKTITLKGSSIKEN